jgi:iron(III) transport system substrate-binding protein
MRSIAGPTPLRALVRGLLGLVAAASLIAAASGCGFGTGDASGGGSEPGTEGITLYSGRIQAAIGPAIDSYEADADRDVLARFAASADLAATLVEEGSASPADVFFGQEAPALGALTERGLLIELPDDILERVPPAYRDPGGRWVGVTGRSRIIAYNADAVDRSELPASPLELTDPEWRGRVGWAPATGSLQEYVTAVRLRYGEVVAAEWLEGMVANDTVPYPNHIAMRDAIASGEIDLGLLNHYYVAQAIAEQGPGYPVRIHFPPRGLGSLLLVTGVGVLESSDRKQEALDFVRSLLSKDSQRFFTESSKEYPLVAGVEPDPVLDTPLEDVPAPEAEITDLEELQRSIELMQDTGAL